MVKVKFLVFSMAKTHFVCFITYPTLILLFFTFKPNAIHLFINFFLTSFLLQKTPHKPTHTTGHKNPTNPHNWPHKLNNTSHRHHYHYVQNHSFQNQTGLWGRTMKTRNRDENRFFKPKEPYFLLIP